MKTPVLNNDEMSVESYGRKSHLTPKEYGILKLLINNPGRAFTSDEIYEKIWNCRPFDTKGIIAVHLRHIREKIERDPSRPVMIRSLWGRGYQFTAES